MEDDRPTIDRGVALRGLGLLGLLVAGLVGVVGYRVIDASGRRQQRLGVDAAVAKDATPPNDAASQNDTGRPPDTLAAQPSESSSPFTPPLEDGPAPPGVQGAQEVSPASFSDERFAEDAVEGDAPESESPTAPAPVFVAPGDR